MGVISRALATIPIGNGIPVRAYRMILRKVRRQWIAKTYFGALMACDLTDFIQSSIFHFGVWEPNISPLIERLAMPGSTVVDVGANVGYYSLLAALRVEDAHVVSFEPSPAIMERLLKNIALNHLGNIRAVETAVGDRHGRIPIYDANDENIGRTSIREDSGFSMSGRVELIPLCDALTNEERRSVSVIKIDVEGAEIPILRNVVNNLDGFGPNLSILVEASDVSNPEWQVLFKRLTESGFRAYQVANDYSWRKLGNRTAEAVSSISAVPNTQADLVFTRIRLL